VQCGRDILAKFLICDTLNFVQCHVMSRPKEPRVYSYTDLYSISNELYRYCTVTNNNGGVNSESCRPGNCRLLLANQQAQYNSQLYAAQNSNSRDFYFPHSSNNRAENGNTSIMYAIIHEVSYLCKRHRPTCVLI
jgi:hypothetical protein